MRGFANFRSIKNRVRLSILTAFRQPRRTRKTLTRWSIGLTALTLSASTPVAAQQQVGADICGTPLADTVNFAAPLFVGITMIASAILAYVLHNAAAFPKSPQSVEAVKNWRNRAAFSTVTTPLVAVVIQMLLQSTGIGIANCVNIIPFF